MEKHYINRFIHKERTSAKEAYDKGVYSLEFALGLLAGLNNLAAHNDLRSLMDDIRNDVEYLRAMQWRKEKLQELEAQTPQPSANVAVWR